MDWLRSHIETSEEAVVMAGAIVGMSVSGNEEMRAANWLSWRGADRRGRLVYMGMLCWPLDFRFFGFGSDIESVGR